MASNEPWRPVINGLLYTVQFREALDEDYAAHLAKYFIDRPLAGLTADQQYTALSTAADSGTELTQMIPEAHSEADFRSFVGMVVAQMDALRPWPEPPFERVTLARWDEFPTPVVIGRLTLMAPDVQSSLKMALRTLPGLNLRGLVLRLKSGALVALIARWWPESRDTAVIAQDDERDPDEILRELLDATQFPEEELIKTSS